MATHSADEARRSLETISSSRLEIAVRLSKPWWHWPVIGGLSAQVVLAYGLLPTMTMAGLSAVVLGAAFIWMLRIYETRTGLVDRSQLTLRSGLVKVLLTLGILVPLEWVLLVDDLGASVVVALALAAFASTVVLGPALDAVRRADLRRGQRLA